MASSRLFQLQETSEMPNSRTNMYAKERIYGAKLIKICLFYRLRNVKVTGILPFYRYIGNISGATALHTLPLCLEKECLWAK
ncbi:hypothetical protein CAP35_01730 [Chitinophagaceae bacterium IBVUCB1]|nr:hypothetical protein CAP35_01730 [Chitinophagaceae bacterium IBVUCB1]